MDLIQNLGIGFQTALSFQNLLYAFMGAVLGTLIGVLPGLGPVATIAMLLPSIYALDATPALIMLAGIYYGAQYGGSTTAILINVPGESASVVTAIDGYQMARQGRAGAALAAAGLGSFFAGSCCHAGGGGVCAAADRAGVQVRAGRVLLADGAGPDRCRGAGVGLADQGHRDDHPRAADGADQHRRDLRRAALQLRHPRADRRHRLRRHRDGRVRLRRDHRQPRAASRTPRGVHQGREGPVANQGRLQGRLAFGAARHDARLDPRRAAGRRCAAVELRHLHDGKEDRRREPAVSARATSAAWPAPRVPTTPARRRRSFRCSRWAFRPTR